MAAAALLARPATAGFGAGFCSAQGSLLTSAPDAIVLGRERSCGIGDRWLSEHDSADVHDLLYHVHELGNGNNTSLAAWLQMAGRGNNNNSSSSTSSVSSSGPAPSLKVTSETRPRPAGWLWDRWVSNSTAAERRFQQRISSVLVRPLVKFSSRLTVAVPPAALSALLRKLVTESRPAVLAALREVNGDNITPERLLERNGGLVRILASVTTELAVLTSGAAQQMQWAIAPYVQRVNSSSAAANVSSEAETSSPIKTTPSAADSTPTSTSNTDPSSSSPISPTVTNNTNPHPEDPSTSSRPTKPASLLSSQSETLGRAFNTLIPSAPFAFGAAAVFSAVPLAMLFLHLLFGVPIALLLATSLYGGVLVSGALAEEMVNGTGNGAEAGLLLGKTVEAVLGGFFRMPLLRTLLMFALERLTG